MAIDEFQSLTPIPTQENSLFQAQEQSKILGEKANTVDVAKKQFTYPYGWTETSASDLLTAGAYNGIAGFVGVAVNRMILQCSTDAKVNDGEITLQRYVSAAYVDLITDIKIGTELAISGVKVGDQLRIKFALPSTADCRGYRVEFRLQE